MSLKNNNLILVLLLIAGCKQMPQMSVPTLPGLGAHKIDIQQGNVITQDMLDKLQPGMTRNQVRFVLGTPLLVDPFRTDRWDYVYSLRKGGELLEQRQLKVFFQDDKMLRYEGDVVTDTKPGAPIVAGVKPAAKPVAVIAAKPAPVQSVPAPQPALAKAAAEPVVIGKPQLQLSAGTGEPAKPGDIQPVAPAVAAKPESEGLVAPPLDAPPMPRLTMKPEPPDASPPAGPFAVTPDTPKPAAAPVMAKPAEKSPAQPGLFGRLFGQTPAKPVAAAPALTVKPVAPATPAPVVAPVPTPVEKPVVAKPVEQPLEKPADKPIVAKPVQKPAETPATAQRGFFGRMLDAAAKPAAPVRFGEDRTAEPGQAPAPFVDPQPEPKKP